MNARVMSRKWLLVMPPALAALGLAGAPLLRAQTMPVAAAPVQWAKVSVTLPASELAFPPAPGYLVADGGCLLCHSAGMVLRQPPLAQAQWLGEIQKMRTSWGSPLPLEQEAALAAYLAGINGPATAQPAPLGAANK